MLPDRCSVSEAGSQCASPPEFIVSIVDGPDEYMVGVACSRHRGIVSGKLGVLQKEGRMRAGTVTFSPVHAVGTDCIKCDPGDGLLSIDKGP